MSITTLPDEILAEIFEHCVEGDTGVPGGEGLGVSPRILALVNRNWYRVALATASLWRRILVSDAINLYWQMHQDLRLSRMPRNRATRMQGAMEICGTQAQLESALQRTCRTSLDITIAFNDLFRWAPQKITPYDQFYNTLFNDRITPRITRLSFEGKHLIESFSLNYMSKHISTHISTHMAAHIHLLSNLVSLTCLSPQAYLMIEGKSILQRILENAGHLKELFVGIVIPNCLKGEVWQNAGYSSTIRNLQRLTLDTYILDGIFRHVVSIPIAELVIQEAAQIAAQIEDGNEISVSTLYARPWPNKSTQEITFTKITRIHLILDDVSFLSRVHFPVLEHLRLSQSAQCRKNMTFGDIEPFFISESEFSISLPNLRSLRIMAHRFAPLSRFHVPQLESLHMTSTFTMRNKNDEDFSALFPSSPTSITPVVEGSTAALGGSSPHALQSIHTLHINADVSEELLLQALRSLPKLRVLSLIPGKDLGLALVQGLIVEKSKNPSKVKGILCPDLRIVELDLVSFIEWDRRPNPGVRVGTSTLDELSSVLDQCVLSRRNAAIPMQSCTVTDSLGKREYVELDV